MALKLIKFLFLLSTFSVMISSFADTQTNEDPYQTYNRHAFAMNKTIDKNVYKPIAVAYKTITPNLAQNGIQNFFNNIATVPVIVNDVLQLNGKQTMQDSLRLLFNTTFGILGLVDVSTRMGLPDNHNDFGMTLAKYGYRNSNYFIIPFLGPSTVRDTFGFAVDYEYFSVYPYIDGYRLRDSLLILDFIQTRAHLLRLETVMDQAAVDPYVFQRNAYMQRRHYLIEKDLNGPASANGMDNDPYVA